MKVDDATTKYLTGFSPISGNFRVPPNFILISHVNYPSQFRRLSSHWIDLGHEVVFIASKREWHSENIDALRLISSTAAALRISTPLSSSAR